MKTWTKWSDEEVNTLINTMVECAERGIPVRESLEQAAIYLTGKTEAAVSRHWYKYEAKDPKVIELLEIAKSRKAIPESLPAPVVEVKPKDLDDPVELARGLVRVVERMFERNKELTSEVDTLSRRIRDMEQTERDFNDMVRVMAKARQIMIGEEDAASKATFKMDQNGNLERIT